jgi:hypothetical protein
MKALAGRIILIFMIFSYLTCYSQIKGVPPPASGPDTTIVFLSPRPLILPEDETRSKNAAGLDLLFSIGGAGVGFYYMRDLGWDLFAYTNIYMYMPKNTDEIEYYDAYGQTFVKDKINRVFAFPVTIGLQKLLNFEDLGDSFVPYLNTGLGPSFIITTPYEREFFNSLGYTTSYVRFGMFFGAGLNFNFQGVNNRILQGLYVRYCYVPFGGNGLESIKKMPMTNLGGLFISYTIGVKF